MCYFKKIRLLIIVIVMGIGLSGCGSEKSQELYISAAASLTEVVETVAEKYETPHTLQLNFAGTQVLKTQVLQGAEVDVFISADYKHFQELEEKGYIKKGQQFATNQLVAITSVETEDTPDLTALQKDGATVVVAAAEVPAGRYTSNLLEKADQFYGEGFSEQVRRNIVSEESNVRQVLSKVMLGEADYGFVYQTDVTADMLDKLQVIPLPDVLVEKATYWIGQLNEKEETTKLYEYFLSQDTSQVLEAYGFGK